MINKIAVWYGMMLVIIFEQIFLFYQCDAGGRSLLIGDLLENANWQLATSIFYGMISLDNDPTPLLGLTDVTCCPCHVCVSLNETPMI